MLHFVMSHSGQDQHVSQYHVFASAEPLFLDPYAGCFVPHNSPKDVIQDLHPYCLATKFIDDKLLHTVSLIDGLKQVLAQRMYVYENNSISS